MANLIELAKQNADELLRGAYQAAVAAETLPAGAELTGTVEIPKDVSNGDYAANHAMVCARALHLPPRKIAEALAAHCALDGSFFSSVSVAGPGFINFRLSERWYGEVLRSIREEGMAYGHVSDGAGKRVNVEFVSANPTGPMHLGNARGGVLGDALASVLSFAGYEVSREFYVNDAGNQIEKFASSIDARYHQLAEGKIDWPDLPERQKTGCRMWSIMTAFRLTATTARISKTLHGRFTPRKAISGSPGPKRSAMPPWRSSALRATFRR